MNYGSQLADWLLRTAAAPLTRSALVGDLLEEFHERSAGDPRKARRWFWRQVIHSLLPLAQLRLQRANVVQQFLLAYCAVILPIVAIDRFTAFILSSIPLKDDTARSPQYFAVILAVCLASCSLSFLLSRGAMLLFFMLMFLAMIPIITIADTSPAFLVVLALAVVTSYFLARRATSARDRDQAF
jgi:hypothetical protein